MSAPKPKPKPSTGRFLPSDVAAIADADSLFNAIRLRSDKSVKSGQNVVASEILGKYSAGKTPSPSAVTAPGKTGTDWIGIGTNVIGAAIGAAGADQALPQRERNPELARIEAEMRDRAEQGMTPAEHIQAKMTEAEGYARDIDAITSAVANGGDAAAVLSAIGGASSRATEVGRRTQVMDSTIRDQNRSNYYDALKGAQSEADREYELAYNNTVASKNQMAEAMGANLTQLADRTQYEKEYGPGSSYDDLLKESITKRKRDQAFATAPVTSIAK